jgi:23S rRNA (uracil1939-C5)-methyltransferase
VQISEQGSRKEQSDSKSLERVSRRPAYAGGKTPTTQGSCQFIRDCGGCRIMQQSYEADLKEKQKTVDALIKPFCKVEQIIGMENPKYYRNKVHVVFDHDRKGNPVSGVYEEGSHNVVPIDNCLIHNQKADAIIESIRGMLKSFKIKTYDEDSDYGLLRHVLVRTGFTSGEIMVVLVLSSPILPSKNNFVKALRDQHPEISTIVVNVNDKKSSMVLGNKEQVIYGKGFIEDTLCGKVFRISPKSFYQVNPVQAELIYNKAIKMAEFTGTETVVDAYCGIGTIGLIVSDHVSKVIGVEINKDAVHDANINAKRNDVKNIEFYKNDAGEFMSQMAEQKEHVDVVIMDPPRTGSNEQFMDALAALKAKKVIYISCNPITLERDLQYLKLKGYKAEKAVPVDMFPWTGHVETVVLISRKDN